MLIILSSFFLFYSIFHDQNVMFSLIFILLFLMIALKKTNVTELAIGR